jgi:hypothetical protein
MPATPRRRLLEALPFVCLTLAVIAQSVQPVPDGPWDGIYTNYPLYWSFVGLAGGTMLVAISRYRLSWSLVCLFAVLFLFTVVSHSFLWALPWGLHDPWKHLANVRGRRLSIAVNIYPLFHSFVAVVSLVTGLGSRAVLSGLMLFVSVVGVLFVAVTVRHTDAPRRAQQTAAVAILPGLFLGFLARPFSLAYPFVLVGFWFATSRSRGLKLAATPILVALALVHPFVAALTLGVLLVANAVRFLSAGPVGASLPRPRPSVSVYLSVAVGIELAYLLFLGTNFSDRLLLAIGESLASSGSVSGGPAGAGLIAEAFSSRQKSVEFLSRSSFLLSLAVPSAVVFARQLRTRRVRPEVAVATVSGLGVLGLFVVLAYLPAGIGITRLFVLAPLFFLPLLPYAFGERTRVRRLASVGLAALVLTTGLLTGFMWPGIGGVEYSATEGQIAGVEWSVDHAAVEIVGTDMTHWIVVGKHGRELSRELSPTRANGMLETKSRAAAYSWEVTDRPPGALYVVDGAERARARQAAREGNSRPVRCLRAFRARQSRVYSNGDTGGYVVSRPPACGVIG